MSEATPLEQLVVIDVDGVLAAIRDAPESHRDLFPAGGLPERLNPAHAGWLRELTAVF
jgi:hypothetical protein